MNYPTLIPAQAGMAQGWCRKAMFLTLLCTSILRFRFVPAPYAEQGQESVGTVICCTTLSTRSGTAINLDMASIMVRIPRSTVDQWYDNGCPQHVIPCKTEVLSFLEDCFADWANFLLSILIACEKGAKRFFVPEGSDSAFFATLTRRVGCFLRSGTTRFDLFAVIRHTRVDSPLTRKHLKNRGRTACPMAGDYHCVLLGKMSSYNWDHHQPFTIGLPGNP